MSTKRIVGIAVAVIIFLVIVVVDLPTATDMVVVAARDLAQGGVIGANDVVLSELPEDLVPADAIYSVDEAVGNTLAIDRAEGDLIRLGHLGEPVVLAPNEVAVSIHVTDSSGLAGSLQPGDWVGVVAIIQVQGSVPGTYSKLTIQPLRVLAVSPEFEAIDPNAEPDRDPVTGLAVEQRRESEGTVTLVVPVTPFDVYYDFSSRDAPDEVQIVNGVEMLAALDASPGASISLFLTHPPDAGALPFVTSGIFLPDLVITPGPTPTATETPEGYEPDPTATPTVDLTVTPTVEITEEE